MSEKLNRKVLKIEGMTCINCEISIERRLKKLNGIEKADVSYEDSTAAVLYRPDVIDIRTIIEEIEGLGYIVSSKASDKQISKSKVAVDEKFTANQLIGGAVIIAAGFLVIKNTVGFNFIPQVTQNMGYGILFIIGMITSIHCIAMCGGINLSQCISYKFAGDGANRLSKLKPSIMYNLGRVISYTIVGGIVGAFGSVFSFSGAAKGAVAVISGVFMLIMGLNMLNIFPWLRKFNPRMPKVFGTKISLSKGKHGPFYVGILNGLMPCGPLQAMQIYALGTGSMVKGAAAMFFFSIGTVPLMFGFGAVSSFLSSRFTHKMMKVSAMLVIILGVIMLNRGLSLSGISPLNGIAFAKSQPENLAKVQEKVQYVTTQLGSNGYASITVQKGVPVKWTINAAESDINGCNGTLVIPKFGITKRLAAGTNVIEFTPSETGNIPYSCWMGMIRSNILVVSDIKNISKDEAEQAPIPSGNGMGAGCCGN